MDAEIAINLGNWQDIRCILHNPEVTHAGDEQFRSTLHVPQPIAPGHLQITAEDVEVSAGHDQQPINLNLETLLRHHHFRRLIESDPSLVCLPKLLLRQNKTQYRHPGDRPRSTRQGLLLLEHPG